VNELLRQQGVMLDERLVRSGLRTITKSRVMAQRQQVCRLDWEARPDHYTLTDAELELLAERAAVHDAVILSDYAKGVIGQPVLDRMREVARRKTLFLAMDPKPKRALDVRGMHLLTPNRTEAVELSGLSQDAASAASLDDLCGAIQRRYDPEHLVVTLSEDGILLSSRSGDRRRFPTVAREVADVSGAGDTVVATLTAALAAGMAPADAVHLANVAAGLVVAKLGTATVTRAELATALEHETLASQG
jgi:D-beta-D-heptose 7-phosphate kinase/D-beta-D-heptose 1-phosphate adenosyltransferase